MTHDAWIRLVGALNKNHNLFYLSEWLPVEGYWEKYDMRWLCWSWGYVCAVLLLFNRFMCLQKRCAEASVLLALPWRLSPCLLSLPGRPFIHFFFSEVGKLPSCPQPLTHACYLFLVPQSCATFLPKSGIFLFINVGWIFKHYDWHFAIWAELILYKVFLNNFLTLPNCSFIHPPLILTSVNYFLKLMYHWDISLI